MTENAPQVTTDPAPFATPAEGRYTVDAAAVFTQLVREVDAGRALVAMTPPGQQHRAAIDALALCRDVLTDARDLFGRCACGAVELHNDAGDEPAAGELLHHPVACVELGENGEQL